MRERRPAAFWLAALVEFRLPLRAVCLFFFRSRPIGEVAQRMRDEHSAWLTEALRRGQFDLPRIPVKRADQGGFSELTESARGREVCERWWRRALRAIFL